MVGEAGELTDISQENALAQQIQNLTDPEVHVHYSAEARAQAERLFSKKVVIDQYLDIYSQVLNPSTSTAQSDGKVC